MLICAEMKRRIAWLLAILSGLYLLTLGLMPDPIPFIDEGIALWIFVKATGHLGYDVTRWIPFLSKKKATKVPVSQSVSGPVIDV
jgi:hypothetical protein